MKLYIIGNGFDIAHGLPTQYWDFRKYLEKVDYDFLRAFEMHYYIYPNMSDEAKKNLIEVPIKGTTIPHEYVGKFGSASVMLKPGAEGSGVIAGGSVRPVLELAGYKDIKTKIIGTNNPRNVVYATIDALKNMQTAEEVAAKRGKKVSEIL